MEFHVRFPPPLKEYPGGIAEPEAEFITVPEGVIPKRFCGGNTDNPPLEVMGFIPATYGFIVIDLESSPPRKRFFSDGNVMF
jgi:hypothetical protein